MTEKDLRIAEELKKRLAEQVGIVAISVFGSRARGDATDDSDMDVFIEVERLDKDIRECILNIAWEISLKYLTVVSPLIFTREEIENSPLRSSPIVKVIQRDGRWI